MPYQVEGSRSGAALVMISCRRSASSRSSGGISAILSSRSCSPTAPLASLARSFIAARSSAVNPLLLPAIFGAAFVVVFFAVAFVSVAFVVVGMVSPRGRGGLSRPFSERGPLQRFSKTDHFCRILTPWGDERSTRRVELVAVADGVGTDLGRGVRVDGQQPLGLFGARLAGPDLGPPEEEPLGPGVALELGWLLTLRRDPVGGVADGQPPEVADVLAHREGTVDLLVGRSERREGAELGDERLGALVEAGPVLLGPPVAQGAGGVVARPLVIEAVPDLVPDDGTDPAVVDGV